MKPKNIAQFIEGGKKTRFTHDSMVEKWSDADYKRKTGAKISQSLRGRKISDSQRKKMSDIRKAMIGDKNPSWKGGRTITKAGYVLVIINGKRMLEHRYVMEQNIGRKLLSSESVHHINGNKSDNRIENLELTNKHDHPSMHIKYFGCAVTGCDNKHFAHGFCKKHLYKEYYKKLGE